MTYANEALDRPLDVLDAVHSGILIVDHSGVIEYANPRAAELAGRIPAELLGRSLRSLCPKTADWSQVEHVLSTLGSGIEREFLLGLPDGTQRPTVICGRVLPHEAGQPPRFVVTLQDITIQKAAELEAREQFDDISTLTDNILVKAVRLEDYSRELEEVVRRRTSELHEANLEAITMLAVASEAKDADTGEHVRRIRRFAEAVAARLGFERTDAIRIGYSAILHDVGKFQVPDAILKKPGLLTDEERGEVERHTIVGERILSKAPFFELARQIARNHHENYDGSGYPDGLAGEQIPIAARIVRVVDVYDGLCSRRAYKEAWSVDQAADYIRDHAGRLFDPQVVRAFLEALRAGEIDRMSTAS